MASIEGEKDPRWLLSVMWGAAAGVFSNDFMFISQVAHGTLPDVEDTDFFGKLALNRASGIKIFGEELFEILVEEAKAYSQVFDKKENNLYTDELVRQVREHLPHLVIPDDRTRQNPGNLLLAVTISAMRDLALVEELHQNGQLNEDEHAFALRCINSRMDRTGLNGLGRMLIARPELQDFLRHDTTIIDARHIKPVIGNGKRTRAACYSVLTKNRDEQPDDMFFETTLNKVIDGDFNDLQRKKARQISGLEHSSTPEPFTRAEKEHFQREGYGEGFLPSIEQLQKDEKWKEEASARLTDKLYKNPEAIRLEQYIRYHGVALNHPERDVYADKIREQMGIEAEVVSEHEGPSKEDEVIAIVSSPQEEVNDVGIDAEIVGEEEEPVNKPGKELELRNKYPSEQKPEIIDAEVAGESKHSSDKLFGTLGKIATISAGGTAVGLVMADALGKGGEEQKKNRALKFAVAAGALAVAVGGAILWTRKPEALYQSLNNNIRKNGPGRS